jgi:hypothetical protein
MGDTATVGTLGSLEELGDATFSVQNIADYGVTHIRSFEANMKAAISAIKGQDAKTIDQGTLLELQMNVQNWSTLVAMMTGLLRAIGDGMAKVTQNIR